jgi:hypothetical protein
MWIVDPLARTLEVFAPVGERWSRITAHAADELARAAPFDAIELERAGWWLPTRPRRSYSAPP